MKENGFFDSNRLQQSKYWLFETINQQLQHSFYESEAIKARLAKAIKAVTDGKQTSFKAANELLAIFQKKNDFTE
jgi:LAO/AO transport system kinase